MWSYDQVLAELMRALREVTSIADLSSDTKLGEIADFDSLDFVEFVMYVETTFECDLGDAAYSNDTTIAELARAVWSRMR
jgi:acyl carrier protein